MVATQLLNQCLLKMSVNGRCEGFSPTDDTFFCEAHMDARCSEAGCGFHATRTCAAVSGDKGCGKLYCTDHHCHNH